MAEVVVAQCDWDALNQEVQQLRLENSQYGVYFYFCDGNWLTEASKIYIHLNHTHQYRSGFVKC